MTALKKWSFFWLAFGWLLLSAWPGPCGQGGCPAAVTDFRKKGRTLYVIPMLIGEGTGAPARVFATY